MMYKFSGFKKNVQNIRQSGRSMIEMLGVLAIIGVLSVGGIAGYSKAMGKWQKNKQLEQISMLFYNILDTMDYFSNELKKNPDGGGQGIPVLAAINRIPEGMTVKGNYVYDAYGNSFSLYYGIGTCRYDDGTLGPCKINMQSYVGIRLQQHGSSFALTSETQCHNIVKAAGAFGEYLVSLESRNSNDSISGYEVSSAIYGKNRCRNGVLCFNTLTPVQENAFCKSCASEVCSFILYFVIR